MSTHAGRLKGLRRSLRAVDAMLVTDMRNVRYLTGFTGSSGYAVVSRDAAIFVTDFRYKEQSRLEVFDGWDVDVVKRSMPVSVRDICRKLGVKKLGFESSVSYGLYEALRASFRGLRDVGGVVEKLRERKDAQELASIRRAVDIAQRAFRKVKPHIKAGVKESSIALRLEERLRKEGSGKLPFDIIVAAGPNSAMPHAQCTGRKLFAGDLVVVDWGARAEGYCSDMTRTLLLRGGGLAKKREIYSAVLEANRGALARVASGVGAREIDNTARDIIKKAGYGGCFGHALGHGVGLDVHERPSISQKSTGSLKDGMVFTVEPGVYVPGLGGVRIEDMVALAGGRAVRLTSLGRKLEIV